MNSAHRFRIVDPWYGTCFTAPPYGAKNLHVAPRFLENLWTMWICGKKENITMSVLLLLSFMCIKAYTIKNFSCDLSFPQL